MRTKPRLIILLAVLALRLPFLFHPIQGDDAFYLTAAQHALIEPLHPHNFVITAQGMQIDMRGFPHPPGNAWILAAILALFGDVYEPLYHAVYLLFSLIAAFAAFSIAKRFCQQPLWATLLFLATPAFVINGTSLETDLPFLAFWLAATALFLQAVDSASTLRLISAAVTMFAAAQISYQAVILVPILAAHLWIQGTRRPLPWLAILTPALTIALWQIYERSATGAAPAEVLSGHFATHNLQSLANKIRNAAALTVHLGWMQSPLLAPHALIAIPAAIAAAFFDPNPLFWLPFAIGIATLYSCRRPATFLNLWLLIFFAAALVLFFAGSARYLLPIALPLAILAVNRLADHPRLLAAALATHLILSLTLAASNQALWNFHKETALAAKNEIANHRTFVNAEWGLRFYAETAGAIPLRASQSFRNGDRILTSALGAPVRLPEGPRFAQLSRNTFDTPFRLIALNTRSAYSSAAHARGLRAFDIASGPVDIARLVLVNDLEPTLSFLPMNAPEADSQIVSGVYSLESNTWRWTARRAVFALKTPSKPAFLEATFRIVDQTRNRAVTLSLNGTPVATAAYPNSDQFTLRSTTPLAPPDETATVTLEIAEPFQVPGDQRQLGLILTAIGFQAQ